MKLLVCGSRTIEDIWYVYKCLDEIFYGSLYVITEIIEGGADGVDSLAGLYAVSHDIKHKTVRPKYNMYGDRAPLIRNAVMVDMCDKGIAIWDGESTGTAHTIHLLELDNKLLKVFQ